MGFFINVSYVINGSFLMIKKMEFRQKKIQYFFVLKNF